MLVKFVTIIEISWFKFGRGIIDRLFIIWVNCHVNWDLTVPAER
jgi:hypothetical protein